MMKKIFFEKKKTRILGLMKAKQIARLAVLGLAAFLLGQGTAKASIAAENGCRNGASIPACILSQLANRWPEASVSLEGEVVWSEPALVSQVLAQGTDIQPNVVADQENGLARIQLGQLRGQVRFQALKEIWAASRRIYPSQTLDHESVKGIEVDIARSPHKENRHLYLAVTADVKSLEAKQSLLEGQPISASAVQVRPDVRRGDALQVELILGDILLSARAQALENGLKGSRLRVLLEKNRRELVGKLRSDGKVEVHL